MNARSIGKSALSLAVLPSVAIQGYLSLSDLPDGSAVEWNARLEAAVGML